MENRFNLVFTGYLRPGTDEAEFVAAFCRLFNTGEEQARQLARAGREVTLKKGIDMEKGRGYCEALENIGLLVRLDPVDQPLAGVDGLKKKLDLSLVPIEDKGAVARQDPSAPPLASCPKCGSTRIDGDNCLDCGILISRYLVRQSLRSEESQAQAQAPAPNGKAEEAARPENPYATPTASLATGVHELGEMTGPVRVAAGRGWSWIRGGFQHFRANPGSWILAQIAFLGIAILLEFIPVVGGLAFALISPILMGGLMIGAQAQEQGENFSVSHLFAGFSANWGQLLLLGVIYLAAAVLISLLAMALLMGSFAPELAMMAQTPGRHPMPEDLGFTLQGILLPMLVLFALLIPLAMATWFAPALIALDGMGPFSAMKYSLIGCAKNILSFLVYGLLAFVFLLVASLPFGLGLIVMIPVLSASIYASYRNIFYEVEDTL